MRQTPALADDTEKYLPYLLEIRRRLFLTILLFALASGVGFLFYEKIIRFILNIFHLEGVNIVFTSPFQFINLAIQSSLIVGVILIFPIVIYQVVSFLKPALSPQELKNIIFVLPLSIFLFLTGFSYGIIIMRYTIAIFYQKSIALSIGNLLDVSTFLSQTLMTALLMGIALQFPLIMTILMRAQVVSRNFFVKKRIIFYGSSLIFATLLPPTDLLSLVFLFSPLIVMYELTILLNKVSWRS